MRCRSGASVKGRWVQLEHAFIGSWVTIGHHQLKVGAGLGERLQRIGQHPRAIVDLPTPKKSLLTVIAIATPHSRLHITLSGTDPSLHPLPEQQCVRLPSWVCAVDLVAPARRVRALCAGPRPLLSSA